MKPIIDLSYYQKPELIDYDLMARSISGVIIRAAYGSGVPNKWYGADIEWERHYFEFSKRDTPIGAYHYITEYQPIEEQVEVMRLAIENKRLSMGRWCDVELENNAEPLTRQTVHRYLQLADAQMGLFDIYTSANYWNRIMGGAYYTNRKLWCAAYTGTDTLASWLIPIGWTSYWLWQKHGTETGRIAGYNKGIDVSEFCCDDTTFQNWIGGVSIPEPEPEPVKFPYEAKVTASVLNVRATANGTIIGKLNNGNKVTVYEEAGDWARVNAWVSRKYLNPIAELPPVVPPSGNLAVEPFSQNDPRWKNNQLGTSGVTIGQQGCLITCVAMVARFYGYDTDPARLNQWLIDHNGYTNGNLFNWYSTWMTVGTWELCQWTPAPLDKIDACLVKGEPAICWVDFNPATATVDMHWVLLIGKLDGEDYVMIDPWDGWQGSFKSRYKDARRFIFRIVSYKKG